MKNIFLVIVAFATVAFARPDPIPPAAHDAALYDHNEQGELRWEYNEPKTKASIEFVGSTPTIDSKTRFSFDPKADYRVHFLIEWQSHQVGSNPIPGWPTCFIGGISVHPSAGTSIEMPAVPVFTTEGDEWVASEAMEVPGAVTGAQLNSSDFGMSFHAFQANDGTVFLSVRVVVIATPI